jgi:hypothetical protein
VLVVGFHQGRFAILFPFVMLLALWFAVAALWPVRSTARLETGT